MPYKSREGDRPLLREPSIDLSNDLAEKKVGTDHAPNANEKEGRGDYHLNGHFDPKRPAKVNSQGTKTVKE